jgi:hypothetical protein
VAFYRDNETAPTFLAIPISHFFWVKDKGNFVAIQFKPTTAEKAAEAFVSPTTSVVDTELVSYIKGMKVGDAIELPKDPMLSDRSLKVRVNKAAKVALRQMDWAQVDGGFIARVTAILPAQATSVNGTSNASANTSANAPTPPQSTAKK